MNITKVLNQLYTKTYEILVYDLQIQPCDKLDDDLHNTLDFDLYCILMKELKDELRFEFDFMDNEIEYEGMSELARELNY